MHADSDVTQWLSGLKSGDAQAIESLWRQYFERLVRLAGRKLPGGGRRAFDEEDVALSAFHSLCKGAAGGRFPRLEDRDDLWRLLVCLTARKAHLFVRHQSRQKRGGGALRGESIFRDADGDGPGAGFAQVVADGPTPEFAAQLAEECQGLLDRLGDESLRAVALLKMEGYTNDEIAEKVGCARRSVERRLHIIRMAWSEEAGSEGHAR